MNLWVDHVKESERTGLVGGTPVSCREVSCSNFDPETELY
jgi:hypothetical protein